MADSARLRAQIKATEAQVEAFTLRIDRFLARNLGAILERLRGGDVAATEAAQLLGSLQSALSEAGLNEELRRLQSIYGEQLGYVREEFERLGVSRVFSDADRDTVEALVTFQTQATASYINSYVDDVRQVMMQQILAGTTPDFSGYHDESGASLERFLQTELNTSLAAFSRTITAAKAQELGFDLFIYLGPDDDITRPFCDQLLARSPAIYTRAEIVAMDNGQGLDVMVYGGGYNCRHQWRPISEERARERGWEP